MTTKSAADWFRELAVPRAGLPLELTQVFDGVPAEAPDSVLALSVGHLHRVLSFSQLLESNESDPEQLERDLWTRLDDCSYYAAMVVPFIRQVLERRAGFINEPSPVRQALGGGAQDRAEVAPNLLEVSRELATEFSDLKRTYLLLANAEEFASWCRYFLRACALLLVYASHRIGTLRGSL